MSREWALSPFHYWTPASTEDSAAFFKRLTEGWRQFENNGDPARCRYLVLHDRFYLLVRLCRRKDLLKLWIYERCREVEESPDGHIDIWAREHFKSSLITFGGVLQLMLRNPELRIAIFSHTAKTAKKFVAQLQGEMEKNEHLQSLFPDVLWSNPQRDAPSWSLEGGLTLKRKGNPKEATLECHGLIDSMPTSSHFDVRVYDDVVERASITSPEMIDKCWEAFQLSDNLGVAEGGRVWIIGTRYSFGDPYQKIIDLGIAIPRIHTATDDNTITGHPVLFSQEEWDRRCLVEGEYVISCQHLCNPIAGLNQIFNVEDLQTYEILPPYLNIYILIDPARSRKKGSANTAMVVLGIDRGGNMYLLDGFNHQMDLTERWEHMVRLWEKWRAWPGTLSIKVGYERFGAIADMDFFNRMRREYGPHFEIIELEWPSDGTQSKVDRVQRLTPDIAGKRFYIPFETDPEHLTKRQRRVADYPHRIAQKIIRLDGNRKKYDLVEQFKGQLNFFPHGGLCDLVDAASRIYDMEPRPAAADYYDIEAAMDQPPDRLRGYKERPGQEVWEPRWDEL